jgi:GMP synthase-like glutamine amidotransferase
LKGQIPIEYIPKMSNKQILILNLLFETSLKTSFDNRIAEAFQTIDTPYNTIYLDELRNFSKFEHYTHLLISGSTESAAEENEWYPDLDAIIHRFSSDEKSILGICFGHQFIVRYFLGKEHIRKSSTPEIGWTDITLSDNPIFRKLDEKDDRFDEIHCQTPISQDDFRANDQVFKNWIEIS